MVPAAPPAAHHVRIATHDGIEDHWSVTAYEALHVALNDTTTFGVLLAACAVLARAIRARVHGWRIAGRFVPSGMR
jgi:hypothetical protein